MKLVHLTAFCFFALALIVSAQTPAEPPKPAAGWKLVTSADGAYQFVLPMEAARSGSRTRTVKNSKFSGKSQINYAITKDGTQYSVEALNLGGPSIKGLKIGDIYNIMIDSAKENGATVSDPQDFTAGNLKGREIVVTKDPEVRREAIFVVKNRLFSLSVASKDKTKTTDADATSFLKSLYLVPKDPPPTDKSKTDPK